MELSAPASQQWDPIESQASRCPFPAPWSTLFPLLAQRAMRAWAHSMHPPYGIGRKQHGDCHAHRHIGHLYCI